MIVTNSTQLMFAFLIVGIGFVAIWELFKIAVFSIVRFFGYEDIKDWLRTIRQIYFGK